MTSRSLTKGANGDDAVAVNVVLVKSASGARILKVSLPPPAALSASWIIGGRSMDPVTK